MMTILEAAARTVFEETWPTMAWDETTDQYRDTFKASAKAYLRAAGFTAADMAAEVGSRVVAPVEADSGMAVRGLNALLAARQSNAPTVEMWQAAYRAMIRAAAPVGTEGGE